MPDIYCSPRILLICGIIVLTLPFVAVAVEPAPANPESTATAQPAKTPELQTAVAASPVGSFRIGYVDISKIVEESDMGKVSKAHFEATADKHKAQIETKQKLIEKQKATLEAKLPTYTPEQRAAKIKDYEKKVDELRKMLQKADKEMKQMQEERAKSFFGKIESAARSYGEANGFTIILIKSDLLYLGKNTDVQDVTEALIQQLNKN